MQMESKLAWLISSLSIFRLNTIEPFWHHSISRTHRKCERKQKLPFENNWQKKRAECVHKPTQKRAFHLCRYGSILHSSCRCKLLLPPNVLCKEKKVQNNWTKQTMEIKANRKITQQNEKLPLSCSKKMHPLFHIKSTHVQLHYRYYRYEMSEYNERRRS